MDAGANRIGVAANYRSQPVIVRTVENDISHPSATANLAAFL